MPSKGLILVVEDEDAIRLTLRDYLRKRGYDVLVGDYWVKFLKKYCADKRIIITSGFLKPDFHIPFEVLYKPFDYSELEAEVAKILDEAHDGWGS
jgi:hypothetical protein